MNKKWFEMDDLKKHIFNNKVWIPLYAQYKVSEKGEFGYKGFSEEYFGAHSVIVPIQQKTEALNLEWMDVMDRFGHKPWVDDENKFHSATVFDWKIEGINPVLVQYIEIERSKDVHINQDIILAFGLKRGSTGNLVESSKMDK